VTLTVGSTFTGIGGADLGFEWAGFRVAWQCEFDAWKQQVLRAHWPDVPLYDDITTLHDPPAVDVMLGGFPCQDLSVAGKRKGFDGERSVLAFEFLRVAESIAPRWIVLENVPGLLSSNRGRDFARLVDEMVGCGYGVAWRILDARYFGVPQRRRRVFLVARRANADIDTRTASRLALRALVESGSGDLTPSWPPGENTPCRTRCGAEGGRVIGTITATDVLKYSHQGLINGGQLITHEDLNHIRGASALGDISGALTSRYKYGVNSTVDDGGLAYVPEVSPTVTKKWEKGSGGPSGSEHMNLVSFRKSKRAQTDKDDETWVDDGAANTLNRFDQGDTRTTHAVVDAASTLQSNHSGGVRMDAEGAAGGHLAVEPTTVRRLTPLECERLMGLPDGWTAPVGVKAPDSKRYAACGDAIVTWVAYWIGQRIRMIEEEA
jgi:DNA (cytosine-5)-methyltransferase 1